jgi:hypothetical protein
MDDDVAVGTLDDTDFQQAPSAISAHEHDEIVVDEDSNRMAIHVQHVHVVDAVLSGRW